MKQIDAVKLLTWLVVLAGAFGLADPATTGIVTSNDDAEDGQCNATHCSLREAISLASDGDTITFDAGLAGQTITLGSALPQIIVANLTIDASALADRVTIDGNNNSIFIHRGSGGSFTVDNLVIKNGTGFNNPQTLPAPPSIPPTTIDRTFGGGIYSQSKVVVRNSVISNNSATGSELRAVYIGGGVYSAVAIEITESTISNNFAKGNGGGLEADAVTVTNSVIANNEAEASGGGIAGRDITVTNSTVSENKARLGGGISSSAGFVTLTGCTKIENNTAGNGAQWNIKNSIKDDNGELEKVVDDPYNGCNDGDDSSGSIINPDPDMQIRAGATTSAESILSGSVVNVGSFKRGEIVTVDFLIRNPGAQVLEIGELALPSFLSNAGEPLPETLASFGSALLTLTVDTNSAGALEGEFSLASNDPDDFENPFVFTITGSVSDEPANVLNILPGIDLGNISTATDEDGVVLLSFKLMVPARSTSVTVDSLTLAASNAGIQRASNLKLYIDGGTRGELDARDVFVSSTDDTETLTFTFNARTFEPELPMWFIVVGNF